LTCNTLKDVFSPKFLVNYNVLQFLIVENKSIIVFLLLSYHGQQIPKKFAETIEGSVSENIELEVPTGTTWHVSK
jgi:hypothetical protein